MKLPKVGESRQKRVAAGQGPFVAGLAVALLAGCAPDKTSFFDLNVSGATSARTPVYSVVTGAQDRGLDALRAESLEAVSLSSAVDCVSALRVTQRSLAQQSGVFGAQATGAIEQAEAVFRERAVSEAGREDQTAADVSVAIEKRTQILQQSPSEAAQQSLTCIRTLSGTA